MPDPSPDATAADRHAVPPGATMPPVLARLRVRVDAALARYLDRALPRVIELDVALAPVAEALRSFVLSGGKRLRPALLLLGFEAVSRDDSSAVMGPALALELLHTCALIHDDVVDAAPERRGHPSVHVAFAATHRTSGWNGDADAYGRAVAILAGDLAFVQADELFLESDVAADRLLAGLRRFTGLREEVMAGQYLDLQAATSGATGREIAITIATLKAGRYSVTRPLQIGATLAGASPETVAALARFGDPVGQAFQVRDDILGVFGASDETGKSATSDLAEGKRTLLVAETVARLDEPQRSELLRLLGSGNLGPAAVARARELMRASGGLTAAEAFVAGATEQASDALAELDLAPEVAAVLAQMAVFVRDRRA